MGLSLSLNFIILIVLMLLNHSCDGVDVNAYKTLTSFRDCLTRKDGSVCFKERALEALDETILSDKPIILNDVIEIDKNPKYPFNKTSTTDLPSDISSRSLKLSDILHDKVEEFFKSRVIKFTMTPPVEQEEARKKGGGGGGGDKGGKGGGYMMMAMGGMACMMAQLFMGKIAFMAGSALILAKVALFMSAIIGIKKLSSGGGGGKEAHVVYASEGHGGWHRSLEDPDQRLAYRAHTSAPTGY